MEETKANKMISDNELTNLKNKNASNVNYRAHKVTNLPAVISRELVEPYIGEVTWLVPVGG